MVSLDEGVKVAVWDEVGADVVVGVEVPETLAVNIKLSVSLDE